MALLKRTNQKEKIMKIKEAKKLILNELSLLLNTGVSSNWELYSINVLAVKLGKSSAKEIAQLELERYQGICKQVFDRNQCL